MGAMSFLTVLTDDRLLRDDGMCPKPGTLSNCCLICRQFAEWLIVKTLNC